MAALDSGEVPDVFLVSRGDLADLPGAGSSTSPIGDLLDERDVDFGDGYSRPALEAFASDRKLQCMPYGISPMVIYYNTDLVDFEAMAARGLDVPTVDDEDLTKKPTWTLEQFQAAAEYASRPRRGIAGFYIAPDAARAWRRSSTPAAARSSTTTTSRPRWPSPPTTRSRRSRRCCRRCATRS